jgi:hypothetical protein
MAEDVAGDALAAGGQRHRAVLAGRLLGAASTAAGARGLLLGGGVLVEYHADRAEGQERRDEAQQDVAAGVLLGPERGGRPPVLRRRLSPAGRRARRLQLG